MFNADSKICLEKKCYDISHNWFVVDNFDFSVVNDVSIGRVIQVQVFEKLFESAQVNSDHKGIKSLLKDLNLEWSARSIASLFDSYSDKKQSDILFVYDVNNDPMIQALNIMGSSLEDKGHSVAAVTIDKNISIKCNLSRKVSWFKCFTVLDFVCAVKSIILLRKSGAESFNKYYDFLLRSVGLEKAKNINRYFRNQSFQVLLEVRAILSLLQKKKPKVVVLASDAHRASRIFVFLCKTLNIRTIVYQHGATIWEYGYIPVYADRMLIWGQSSREWFESRGVEKKRLVEIGNIRSDEMGFKQIRTINFSDKKKVYFFPNPIDRDITEKVIAMLLKICDQYNLEGVLKLHPSEKNMEFFKESISEAINTIRICSDPINKVGINPGDVAIVVNSTAGVDCCLEGAYILNVEIDSMPNPIDYEGYGVGIKTTLEDYITNFDRLVSISPEEYLNNRIGFIKSYLGNLDGRVKERACKSILSLAGVVSNEK